MDESNERDVVAPRAALAWAAGSEGVPGRWLYDEADVADARARGEPVQRTEIEARTGRTLLRGVRGHTPLADHIRLLTDVDDLRITLIDLAETAAQALSSRAE